MSIFKKFFKEATPTNNTSGVANWNPLLFPQDEDDLSQDYQTPSEPGQAKWRFSTIWPVLKLTMKGIDDMVDASNEYTNKMDESRQAVLRKNFSKFIEEAAGVQKTCPQGQYWCFTDKKCKPIPRGWHIGYGGRLEQDDDSKNGKNGNGNGSHNGNGSSNGNGGGNGGGNGNGGGGNGG